MDWQQFVDNYGYLAVAVGAFFEGESVLVLAGIAAQQGYLMMPGVIASAFLGAMAGDQFYYYTGRFKGQAILEKNPKWREKSKTVLTLLHKHQLPLILGFRFMYGLRLITPLLIGTSGVKPLRFLILNAAGAAVWALSMGVAGYYFGRALELLLSDFQRYAGYFIWVLVGLAIGVFLLFRRLRRNKHK